MKSTACVTPKFLAEIILLGLFSIFDVKIVLIYRIILAQNSVFL